MDDAQHRDGAGTPRSLGGGRAVIILIDIDPMDGGTKIRVAAEHDHAERLRAMLADYRRLV